MVLDGLNAEAHGRERLDTLGSPREPHVAILLDQLEDRLELANVLGSQIGKRVAVQS